MFDWDNPVLIGHGDGGDVSLWFAAHNPGKVKAVITLDNLVAPIPESRKPLVLSLRASESEPKPGLMPSQDDRERYGISVITIADTRHRDMQDDGSPAQKEEIRLHVLRFFQSRLGIVAP